MDLRQLRYFASILDQGSISRAAEVLRVAQPALSLHLKRLEDELGCALVHRTTRGVVATEAGRRLAQRAQVLLEAFDALPEQVRDRHAAPSGPAAIGIPTSLGTLLTVPLVKAVRQRLPQVRLRVVEGLSGHMLRWAAVGEVDLALVFGVELPPGLAAETLARERLCLVAPAVAPGLASRAEITLDEALEHPLILPGRPHGVREEVEAAAARRRKALRLVVEVDALDQIKALVADGVGYTVLSQRFAGHGPLAAGLAAVPIVRPTLERVISLAHAGDRPLPLAVQAVRSLLLDCFAAHVRAEP